MTIPYNSDPIGNFVREKNLGTPTIRCQVPEHYYAYPLKDAFLRALARISAEKSSPDFRIRRLHDQAPLFQFGEWQPPGFSRLPRS